MAIKAIQTKYKGYHFRSRLEARWAVFFDALGLQWEYEPEGFDLGDAGWYLPDFRVTGLDANGDKMDFWFEVKPLNVAIPGDCQKKLDAFGLATHGTYAGGFILLGGPPDTKSYTSLDPECGFCDLYILWSGRKRPWWFNSRDGLESEFEHFWKYSFLYHDQSHGNWLTDYKSACTAARSARFEHGETPK